jgi:hypothetical protein
LVALLSVQALGLVVTASSSAAKLTKFLTHEDLAGRMVLDQNGEQIALPTAKERHPAVSKGSVPTYLAIPLNGGEHVPASIPTIAVGSQAGGTPLGPLNFDGIVEASLNSKLATSRLVVVDTPAHDYLVEYLPRHQRLGTGSADSVNEVSRLLSAGSNQLTKLTQTGMNDLERFLHISSKSSKSVPILNLQAQVLGSDGLPSPVPEPGTWAIFAFLMTTVIVSRTYFPNRR